MTKRMTPLSTLLGLTTIAAAAPDLFGPSHGTADSRTHAPEGLGNGPLHPASMASTTRGMTSIAADVLGGGTGFKGETLIGDDKGATGHLSADTASLGQDMEAAGAAVTHIELS